MRRLQQKQCSINKVNEIYLKNGVIEKRRERNSVNANAIVESTSWVKWLYKGGVRTVRISETPLDQDDREAWWWTAKIGPEDPIYGLIVNFDFDKRVWIIQLIGRYVGSANMVRIL